MGASLGICPFVQGMEVVCVGSLGENWPQGKRKKRTCIPADPPDRLFTLLFVTFLKSQALPLVSLTDFQTYFSRKVLSCLVIPLSNHSHCISKDRSPLLSLEMSCPFFLIILLLPSQYNELTKVTFLVPWAHRTTIPSFLCS